MDAAHRMDWDILNIGYPQSSQKMIHLIDMDLHIFGLEEIAGSTRPIAVIVRDSTVLPIKLTHADPVAWLGKQGP